MAELIAIDIEAKSTGEVIGIGVYKPGKYRFFRPNELPPNLGDYVQVYHSGSYDMQFGYKGLRHDHDTIIMSSLLPFEHHGLEKLAVQVLGVDPWKGMVKRKKLEVETFNTVMNYNELDCRYTYQLFFKLQSMLKMKGNWEYYLKYSMPLRRELDLLEQEGIRLNQDKLEGIRRMYAQKVQEAEGEIKDKYQKEIEEIEADLLTKAMSKVKTDKAKEDRRLHPEDYNAVFNLQSNDHVLTLFNLCGLSPKKFDRKSLTIKDSTSTEALSKMKGVLPKTFLNWRKAVKMLQFLTKWDELSKDNKIHPRYNQHTVVTGRLSSSDPNIQQVPVRDNPEIRDIFIPDEGKVYVIADYCVTPDTRILLPDLTWKPIGELVIGDSLVGFDENAQSHTGRKFKEAKVLSTQRILRPAVKVRTEKGVIRCSVEHKFLVRTGVSKCEWVCAKDLQEGQQLSYFIDPWEKDESHTGGWLEGFANGEGWVHSNKHGLTGIGLCQKEGKVLEELKSTLTAKGYEYSIQEHKSGVTRIMLTNAQSYIKFLGSIRPTRLLDNAGDILYGKRVWGRRTERPRVLSVTPIGDAEVVSMQTSSGTYISEGYLSHNCQIELRLAGYFSQDDRLIKLIESGGDFHGYVAKDVFNLSCDPADVKKLYPTERSIAKTIVYLTLYGGSADALLEQLGTQGIDKTIQECKTFLKAFANAYPKLKAYGFTVGAMADRQGYVQTLFGRKVWIPKGEGRHKGLNYQLQGSASELNAFSIIASGPEIRQLGGRVVALIHDEIIVECPSDRADDVGGILRQHMLDKVNLNVPLDIDIHIGNTWGAKGE